MKKNSIPCYYIYMKYYPNHKDTLKKILPPIQNVWEVKIQGDVWEKIQTLAHQKEVTYSWIVRYCVFSAINTRIKPDFDVPATFGPMVALRHGCCPPPSVRLREIQKKKVTPTQALPLRPRRKTPADLRHGAGGYRVRVHPTLS